MWRFTVAILMLIVSSSAASADLPCPIDQAQYRMIHDGQWSAGFRFVQRREGWLSDLAFFVHSAKADRDFWYVFDQGNGHHVDIYLYSTADVNEPGWKPEDKGPLTGQAHYFAADSDLLFVTEAPTRADRAPNYILVPELTQQMWYGPGLSAPLDMFKLSGCAR